MLLLVIASPLVSAQTALSPGKGDNTSNAENLLTLRGADYAEQELFQKMNTKLEAYYNVEKPTGPPDWTMSQPLNFLFSR